MKRAALGLLALLLIVPTAGCLRPDYEGQVRQRAQTLLGHLFHEELDACVDMTDPVYVRAQGRDKVKFRYQLLLGISRLGEMSEEDVRIDRVVVSEDAQTGQVYLSLRRGEEWKPLDPTRWVRVEDTWYCTF